MSSHTSSNETPKQVSVSVVYSSKESGKTNTTGKTDATAWRALCSCDGMKYVIIAVGLAMAQQLTGINVFMFYGPKMFAAAGVPPDSILLVTMCAIGGWNLASVFVSFAFIDKLGRRPLLLGSLSVMAVATIMSGIAYSIENLATTPKAVIQILAIMLFIGGFESGPGPIFFVVASESFTDHIKSQGLTLCNVLAWAFNIAIVFAFPLMDASIGAGNTQFVLAGIAVVSFCIIFFRVPETKSVSKEAAKDADNLTVASINDTLEVEITFRQRVVACVVVAVLGGCINGYVFRICGGGCQILTLLLLQFRMALILRMLIVS